MPLEYRKLGLDGLVLLTPSRFEDARGFFCETYNLRTLAVHGFGVPFVQDNYSHSVQAGTVRGLHYQLPPHAQAKLVRVERGSILDVVVDIRRESGTFGQHIMMELSRNSWSQLLIPIGFAHGFCTLEPDTEVSYKVSEFYASQSDAGIAWNDPKLAIKWPVVAGTQISEKDARLPPLSRANIPLEWTT